MAASMKIHRIVSASWSAFIWKVYARHYSKYMRTFTTLTLSSKTNKIFHAKYLLALPAGFSTKVVAASDPTNFEPNDSRLRSSECLKNAAGLAVDSTSAILSQSVYAIIKIEQQYVELIDVLIKLMEYQLQVLGHDIEIQRIEDIVLETRQEINKVNRRRQDLALLFSSVEKLADATAEVAFAVGTDYASTSTGERLNSAQREVQRVKTLSEEAEKQLMQMEASVISRISKHEEKLKKKKEQAQEDTNENDTKNNNVDVDSNNASSEDAKKDLNKEER